MATPVPISVPSWVRLHALRTVSGAWSWRPIAAFVPALAGSGCLSRTVVSAATVGRISILVVASVVTASATSESAHDVGCAIWVRQLAPDAQMTSIDTYHLPSLRLTGACTHCRLQLRKSGWCRAGAPIVSV